MIKRHCIICEAILTIERCKKYCPRCVRELPGLIQKILYGNYALSKRKAIYEMKKKYLKSEVDK